MNALAKPVTAITQIRHTDLPAPGSLLGGGLFTNIYQHNNEIRALISAPKAEGEFKGVIWTPGRELITGALSFTDGLSNTDAMAAAGSEVAIKTRSLRIGGADDWCLPALDQQEVIYCVCKPTTDKNACWSGSNINAIPPTQRYMPDFPLQTTLDAFREGGAEAFETDDWYWSSTQHAGFPDYAWLAHFGSGFQVSCRKGGTCRARVVRSILVIQ